MIPSAMDSIEALAVAIRESLDRGESDGVRLRLVRQFLSTGWFLMPYPELHGIALAETPAALANRGVFIRRASLVNV